MRTFLLIVLLQSAAAQWNPSAESILGDTASHLEVTDLLLGADGTVYTTGQRVNDSIALYLSAVSSSGHILFQQFRTKKFEEKGLFLRPYDADHFIVAGHSEDKTGTFNVRLLKVTYTGNVVWDSTYGDDGLTTMEVPKDAEVDPEGNIIVGGITQSSEIRTLLLKFAPTGALLWSRRAVPFPGGQFFLHDILAGKNGEIYGVSSNTFIADSSNGTVYRWDAAGNVVWSRNVDLAFNEERGTNLLLSGDTLYVVGTPWTSGQNPTTVALLALRTNGELLAYKKFPLYSNQQGVRDFRLLPDGSLVLLTESFQPPHHRLHTMVLSPSFARVYHDSLLSVSALNGRITEISADGFSVIRYGAELSRLRYTLIGSSVVPSAPMLFATGGRFIHGADHAAPFLAAVSRIQGTRFDRVHAALYSTLPSSAPVHRGTVPSSFPVLHAFPNPFNPSVTLRFRTELQGPAELSVFDLLGRRVSVVLSQQLEAGSHSRTWNAERLPSGMYIARLRSGGRTVTVKLLLTR